MSCLGDLKLQGMCCVHGCTPFPTHLLPIETVFTGGQTLSLETGRIRNVLEARGSPWIHFSVSNEGRK